MALFHRSDQDVSNAKARRRKAAQEMPRAGPFYLASLRLRVFAFLVFAFNAEIVPQSFGFTGTIKQPAVGQRPQVAQGKPNEPQRVLVQPRVSFAPSAVRPGRSTALEF